jgi:phage tail-like protein
MPESDIRYDPLTTFCFTQEIDGYIKPGEAFFKSVSGLKSETEVVPYREGGLNGHTHQLVGATKWPNLVLKRGFVMGSNDLIKWRREWTRPGNPGGEPLKRARGKIIQLDSRMKMVCIWKFVDGWPCKWEGPDYDASKSELAVETIEIAHSGLFFRWKDEPED